MLHKKLHIPINIPLSTDFKIESSEFDYEIIMNDKNVLINGACNITINGNVRQLVKGDYHLEVEGDYSQKIHKNHYHKVGVRGEDAGGGNLEQEIIGNHAYNIELALNLF